MTFNLLQLHKKFGVLLIDRLTHRNYSHAKARTKKTSSDKLFDWNYQKFQVKQHKTKMEAVNSLYERVSNKSNNNDLANELLQNDLLHHRLQH